MAEVIYVRQTDSRGMNAMFLDNILYCFQCYLVPSPGYFSFLCIGQYLALFYLVWFTF